MFPLQAGHHACPKATCGAIGPNHIPGNLPRTLRLLPIGGASIPLRIVYPYRLSRQNSGETYRYPTSMSIGQAMCKSGTKLGWYADERSNFPVLEPQSWDPVKFLYVVGHQD